ncbi:MAG: hypothetical protein LDL31_12875 [Prosthecobacter sp.]|jgi:hypothetical protein|nr:hypothetical protein [Prosthecobacter sp.]
MKLFAICFSLAAASVWAVDDRVLESLLILPEPRALRTERSLVPTGAVATVFSPAREIAQAPGIEVYDQESFAKLGLSPESFLERAKRTADRLLVGLKPDLVKGADGRVAYAVYRGERPVMASLVVAPSLAELFEDLFGPEVWAALPDRHALYIFPARQESVAEFAADLAERFREDAHAASPELFLLKKGAEPRVVGAFSR